MTVQTEQRSKSDTNGAKVQVSTLEYYYTLIKKQKDPFALVMFWEKAGNVLDRKRRRRILDNPGKLPTSRCIDLAKYLSEYFSKSIDPLELIKPMP